MPYTVTEFRSYIGNDEDHIWDGFPFGWRQDKGIWKCRTCGKIKAMEFE